MLVKGNKPLLHAAEVVEWAQKNEESTLHTCFVWDDAKAAHEHRLDQARRLIALHIVTATGERKMVSLSVDRVRGGGYRTLDDAVRIKEYRETMLADALAELRRVRAKYQSLKELAAVFEAIDEADRAHAPADAA